MQSMATRTCSTIDEVIEALGVLEAVCRLIGRSVTSGASNRSNWKAAGSFPPDTCAVLMGELHKHGCQAPTALWIRQRNSRVPKTQHADALR